jgi:hypothetical protein
MNPKKVIIFITFLFFIIFSNVSIAQTNSTDEESRPIYMVSSYLQNIDVVQGQNVTINLFIDGVGTPDYARMLVQAPIEIFEPDVEISVLQCVEPVHENTLEEAHMYFDTRKTRTRVTLPIPDIFFYRPYDASFNIGAMEASGRYSSTSPTSVMSPLVVKLKVKDDAKTGDYQTSFTLYYNQSDEWYVDKKDINIHVKDWTEKEWGKLIIHGAAIAAIAGLYLNALPIVYKGTKKVWRFISNRKMELKEKLHKTELISKQSKRSH